MNIKEPFVELDEIDEAVDLTAELEIKEEYIATADKEAIDPPLEMRVGEQNKTGSEKKHSSKINGTEENYYANVYLLNAAQKRYLVFKRALDIVIDPKNLSSQRTDVFYTDKNRAERHPI